MKHDKEITFPSLNAKVQMECFIDPDSNCIVVRGVFMNTKETTGNSFVWKIDHVDIAHMLKRGIEYKEKQLDGKRQNS